MSTRTYPGSTANPNVPKNVYLIAEVTTMSGEIVTTYYIDLAGCMWKVSDWVNNKPVPVSVATLCKLTGDCEAMIYFNYRSRFGLLGT